MSLVKNIFRSKKETESKSHSDLLIESFHQLKERPDFPLTLAESNLKDIIQNANNPEEEMLYILEDSIFASLYATFYEQILITIQENSHLALELIDRFEADHESREQVIASQTENHLNFIRNGGHCDGCPSCENHHDVAELISFYQNNDREFFIQLFLGMQTIQYTMDHLLYNIIPHRPELVQTLSAENVLNLRQYIFNFAQTSKIGR